MWVVMGEYFFVCLKFETVVGIFQIVVNGAVGFFQHSVCLSLLLAHLIQNLVVQQIKLNIGQLVDIVWKMLKNLFLKDKGHLH